MKKINLSAFWIFIFGFIVGITSYNTIYMNKIDRLIKENEYLFAQLKDSLTKLEKIEAANQKKETPILKHISPIIQNNDAILLPKDEIDQYIKVLLNNQLGKELNKIDAELIYSGLNRRILKFKDGEYQLEIKSIILTDTMYIYYSVEKIKSN